MFLVSLWEYNKCFVQQEFSEKKLLSCTGIVHSNILDIRVQRFLKLGSPNPLTVAKYDSNSKTILQIIFPVFLSRFVRLCLQSFEKEQNFMRISNPLEKLRTIPTNKKLLTITWRKYVLFHFYSWLLNFFAFTFFGCFAFGCKSFSTDL